MLYRPTNYLVGLDCLIVHFKLSDGLKYYEYLVVRFRSLALNSITNLADNFHFFYSLHSHFVRFLLVCKSDLQDFGEAKTQDSFSKSCMQTSSRFANDQNIFFRPCHFIRGTLLHSQKSIKNFQTWENLTP